MADAIARILKPPALLRYAESHMNGKWRHLQAASKALTCYERGDIDDALAASCAGLRFSDDSPLAVYADDDDIVPYLSLTKSCPND